jgi:hypothetical protein
MPRCAHPQVGGSVGSEQRRESLTRTTLRPTMQANSHAGRACPGAYPTPIRGKVAGKSMAPVRRFRADKNGQPVAVHATPDTT